MRQYFKIAGHIVCIESDDALYVDQIEGFSLFRVDAATRIDARIDARIDVSISLRSSLPHDAIGEPYFTLKTELATSHFFESSGESVMQVIQDGLHVLSLIHDNRDNTNTIFGRMDPALLRFALWVAYNFSVAHTRTFAVHSSSVVYNGNAAIFLGESGTGKSTHARLVCSVLHGATILNDDSPVIRVEDGEPFVYGSPWSGKNPYYKQQKARLTAVARISQAGHNTLTKVPLHEAIGALLPSFPPELYLSGFYGQSVYNVLSDILERVPVYSLECLPDEMAARLSAGMLF